jgi:hypothetical protein
MQRSTNERQVEPRNLLNSASSYHFRGEGWHAHSLLVMSPMFQQRSRKKILYPDIEQHVCSLSVLKVRVHFLISKQAVFENCHKDDLVLKTVAAQQGRSVLYPVCTEFFR